jgi:hypothetical protein
MTEVLLLDLGSSSLKWQVRSDAGVVLDEGRENWSASEGAPPLPRLRPVSVWMVRVGPEQREEALRARIRAWYGSIPVVSVHPQARTFVMTYANSAPIAIAHCWGCSPVPVRLRWSWTPALR